MPLNPFSPGMPLGPLMPRNPIIDQPPTPQPGVDPNRGYAQSPSGPQGASMQPQQSPTGWWNLLQDMLRNATTGLDPARQQPRTIQTTDPGAGYGQSPSNPMAQQPARQPRPQRPVRDLKPYTGADQIQQQIVGYGMPPRNVDYGVGSASAPWAVGPTRGPKPMSPTFEGLQPTLADRIGYFSSPSGPNWRPPGG